MDNRLRNLYTFLQQRKEYYQAFSAYEFNSGNIKNADALYAHSEEIDYLIKEILRIINENKKNTM